MADFGLAKETELSGETSITHHGQIVGTPSYVSPEQARGSKTMDFRADIYSLGIVLWEMLAGQRTFQGETPVAVLDQHIHTPLPSLREQRAEVSGQIEQLCEWMTRKRPDDRPASYAELRQCVEALLGTGSAVTSSGALPSFLGGEDEESATLFVGRGRELARLEALLSEALARRGQVAFVTGEAGSGKTALLAEFARRALEPDEPGRKLCSRFSRIELMSKSRVVCGPRAKRGRGNDKARIPLYLGELAVEGFDFCDGSVAARIGWQSPIQGRIGGARGRVDK